MCASLNTHAAFLTDITLLSGPVRSMRTLGFGLFHAQEAPKFKDFILPGIDDHDRSLWRA
jgi:hypothetical protein